MTTTRRLSQVWFIVFFILLSRIAVAIDAGDVLRALAVGYGVKASSKPVNDFINKVTANKGLPVGATTKVVPILTVGDKAYIGAAQVAGPAALVSKVEAVYQYYAAFENNKYRVMLLFPNSDINPLNFKRVPGVGLTALVDVSISGAAPPLKSGGIDTGDIVRAAAIGAAITQVAEPLNSFVNKIYNQKGAATTYGTKVVPRISVGERAYIGGVQVVGPKASVARVKAVFVYDELLSSGRYRIQLVIPGDSINPLKFGRVKGVGVSAVIDTTVATSIGPFTKSAPDTGTTGRDAGSIIIGGTGDAALADQWIDRAHAYIKQSKQYIDDRKHLRYNDKGNGKWKGKGKGHKDDDDYDKKGSFNPSAANKRLADARKTLAQARHARAKKNFDLAIQLAQQSMRIADEARALAR